MDEWPDPQGIVDLRKRYSCLHTEGTNKPPQHSEIHNLERDLKKLYNSGHLHGINLYIYGLVLKEQERTK